MNFGKLSFSPVDENIELVATVTVKAIRENNLAGVLVSEIDPSFSDTAAFCQQYNISQGVAANCVIVQAKRGENIWLVACMIPATRRIDVNGIVRRELDARKISFATMEQAVAITKMEYGAINPIGLPKGMTILVEESLMKQDLLIIGSGKRASKLLIPSALLSNLPGSKVLNIAKSQQEASN